MNKRAIGRGLVPRGEMGLVFVPIRLGIGVMSSNLFSALALVIVIVATIVVSPTFLRSSWKSRRVRTTAAYLTATPC